MTSVQKTAVSFLFTVALFAAFAVVAFGGLFTMIDVSFYQPIKTVQLRKQLDTISDSFDSYFTSLISNFTSYAADQKVMTYLEQRAAEDDIQARSNLTGALIASNPGLEGIRLIDRDNVSIHFSTYKQDVLKQEKDFKLYKKYTDLQTDSGKKELPQSLIVAPESLSGSERPFIVYFDQDNLRFVISLPFFDKYDIYRGSIVFYIRSSELRSVLAKNAIAAVDERYTLIASESGNLQGIVFGMPVIAQEQVSDTILGYYTAGSLGPDSVVADTEAADSYIVLSTNVRGFFRVSGMYPSSFFMMSTTVRYLLLLCVFISLFLGMFLLCNLQYDDVSYIRDYIKKLQFALLREYTKSNHTEGWNTVAELLTKKKDTVSKDIIKKVGKHNKKKQEELSQVLEQSWGELLDAIKAQEHRMQGISQGINPEQLRAMLQDVLAKTAISVVAPANTVSKPKEQKHSVEQEHRENASVEASLIEAEAEGQLASVDEVEELSDVEELNEVEELADDVEELSDAEPVEDVEEVDDLEEVEAAEEIDDIESVEDAEPVADAEPVEDAEPVNDAEPVEEVEEVDDLEKVEAAEEIDDIESVEEAEVLEEIEAVNDVEPAESVELLEEPEPVKEVEEADTAEPVASVEVESAVLPVNNERESVEFVPDEKLEMIEETVQKSVELAPQNAEKVKELNGVQDISHPQTSITADEDDGVVTASLELLEDTNTKEFSFTAMTMKNTVITDLHPIKGADQAIITTADGIVSISNTVDTSRVHQDPAFKELVDSVLK